jgi:type VI secretion system secreted protein Hcp
MLRALAATTLMLTSASAQANTSAYLDFQGAVPGDSLQSGYVDWIEIASLGLEGFTRPTLDGAGGRTTTPAKFTELTLTKRTDIATGPLFGALATGAALPDATVQVVRTGPTQTPLLTLTLTAPVVSSFQLGVNDGDDTVLETLTLTYTQLCVQAYAIDPQTGAASPEPQVCYDVVNQAPL